MIDQTPEEVADAIMGKGTGPSFMDRWRRALAAIRAERVTIAALRAELEREQGEHAAQEKDMGAKLDALRAERDQALARIDAEHKRANDWQDECDKALARVADLENLDRARRALQSRLQNDLAAARADLAKAASAFWARIHEERALRIDARREAGAARADLERERGRLAEVLEDAANQASAGSSEIGSLHADLEHARAEHTAVMKQVRAVVIQLGNLRAATLRYVEFHQSCADHHPDDCPGDCEPCAIDVAIDTALHATAAGAMGRQETWEEALETSGLTAEQKARLRALAAPAAEPVADHDNEPPSDPYPLPGPCCEECDHAPPTAAASDPYATHPCIGCGIIVMGGPSRCTICALKVPPPADPAPVRTALNVIPGATLTEISISSKPPTGYGGRK